MQEKASESGEIFELDENDVNSEKEKREDVLERTTDEETKEKHELEETKGKNCTQVSKFIFFLRP